MDFFTHQDAARKKTAVLVCYFLLAVALIVAAVYVAVAVIVQILHERQHAPGSAPPALWNVQLFGLVAAGTAIVVGLGSLYKIGQLKSGGAFVARSLGGQPINPSTQDLDERVVLNVVEEMAIASGVPVPPVYLLDEEQGINAFAAGFSPNDAVIGVTRGTIETLTRDELQGVIAHEFSHILNGDMRLNIRLMGVLHGILLIAIIGYCLLRNAPRAGRGKKGGGAAAAMFMAGLAFLVVGWVGVFFGKLIKSAVSRQREFLADASAVQFTRNPVGIAGALKRIGGLSKGSRIDNAKAEEASHMFFGNAVASFSNLMATHPPLEVRVKRIDPSFDGAFPDVSRVERTARDLHRESKRSVREKHVAAIQSRSRAAAPDARAAAFAFQPDAAVASVGTLDDEHTDYAEALIESLPESLVASVHEPLGAIASVYCLLLDADVAARREQVEMLNERAGGGPVAETRRQFPLVQQIGPEARLPLLELALPALQLLSTKQYEQFRETVRQLVEADRAISLFEYALQRMLLEHLAPRFERRPRPAVQFHSLQPLLPACREMLSTLSYVGQRDGASAARAFEHGAARLAPAERRTVQPTLEILSRGRADLHAFDNALNRLAAAAPALKKRVLEACAATIGADGRITVEEGELLRVIAESLDCPMPPLFAAQTA